MSISDRIRAGIEAAPWVIEKVRKLEAEVERLKGKLMEEARWVYDTGQRAKDALAEVERLRGVVWQVRALSVTEERDYRCVRVVEQLRGIHEITKEQA